MHKQKAVLLCQPDWEELVVSEMMELGVTSADITPPVIGTGKIECNLSFEILFVVVCASTLVESVRLKLADFRATSLSEFIDNITKIEWYQYLVPGNKLVTNPPTILVNSNSTKFHTKQIAHRITETIKKMSRKYRPNISYNLDTGSEQNILVNISSDQRFTILIKASNKMHKRTYSQDKWMSDAPLNETLASGCLRLISQDMGVDLNHISIWDPFCGSSTILTEAWAKYQGLLPGYHVSDDKPMFRWPKIQRGFLPYTKKLDSLKPSDYPAVTYMGSDISPRAIESSKHNFKLLIDSMKAVGYRPSHLCKQYLEVGDFRSIENSVSYLQKYAIKPKKFAIVSNPPYGKLIAEGEKVW
eukprot:TRINITY_DN1498_c0_g1_i6.p1 TRINITY_DN1498_c0_g1~~TRINITY_DN1498_c0_g1_i6.p1  ORF type:complete len:358 (-),score=55.61 TRINITY_DN1498_c0_g1_i6:259-1332(-)